MTTTTPSVRVDYRPRTQDWKISTDAELTDAQAMAITFRAEPKQVVLGAFVEVVDAGGTRIGHVSTAVYRERWDGPSYVVVTITLR